MQLCVFMSLFNCIVLAYIMRNKTWWWWWYRSDQSIFREYPCDQRTNRQILPKTAPSRGDFDPHVTQSSKPPTASPSVKPIIRHTSVWDIVRPYDHQRGPKHESKGPINIFLFQPLFTIVHQSPVPADSSPSMVVVLFAHLPTGHSLFHGLAAVLATKALLLQDHACGTIYPTNLQQMTSYEQFRRHLKSH